LKIEAAAHLITGVAADKAIGVGDGTADPRAAAAPGHRPATTEIAAVPVRTCDHVVAVTQEGDVAVPKEPILVAAHIIIGVAANEGADERPTQSVKQIHGTSPSTTE